MCSVGCKVWQLSRCGSKQLELIPDAYQVRRQNQLVRSGRHEVCLQLLREHVHTAINLAYCTATSWLLQLPQKLLHARAILGQAAMLALHVLHHRTS